MSKPKTQPVGLSQVEPQVPRNHPDAQPVEPLSGSKKVKNRNHSRQNHGDGN